MIGNVFNPLTTGSETLPISAVQCSIFSRTGNQEGAIFDSERGTQFLLYISAIIIILVINDHTQSLQ